MEQHSEPGSSAEGKAAGEPNENKTERSYLAYGSGTEIGFDPTKDLNLPESYDEVLQRFNKLQGDRAMEALN